MKEPIVSILILNYRNARQAVLCVRSLLKQSIAKDMEILVIDNDSDDDSRGILRASLPADPRVRMIESAENKGFGAGYNLGARHARGTYLLFNNPDKIPEPAAVERMVRAMQAEPAIGILAPKLLHHDGTRRYSVRRFPHPIDCVAKRSFLRRWFEKRIESYLQLDMDPDAERDTDWVIGGCFMIERVFFERLKGFDETYFLFFEDIDICRRCALAGKKVRYFPSAVALDKKRRLSEGGALSMITSGVGRAHIVSAFRYFRRWGWGAKSG